MIGDTHHVAVVAPVLGDTKAAAIRYIHVDEEGRRPSDAMGAGWWWQPGSSAEVVEPIEKLGREIVTANSRALAQ